MLRFIKHNMASIEDISLYPIISLLIFVLFFVLVILRVWKLSKQEIETLEALPFEDANETTGINCKL